MIGRFFGPPLRGFNANSDTGTSADKASSLYVDASKMKKPTMAAPVPATNIPIHAKALYIIRVIRETLRGAATGAVSRVGVVDACRKMVRCLSDLRIGLAMTGRGRYELQGLILFTKLLVDTVVERIDRVAKVVGLTGLKKLAAWRRRTTPCREAIAVAPKREYGYK